MRHDLKVCLVTHTFLPNYIGGREKHTYCLAKHLGEMGLKVDILTGDDVKKKKKEVLNENVVIERCPMYSFLLSKSPNKIYYRFVPSIFNAILKADADVIHAQDYFHFTSDAAAFAVKLNNHKPFILSVHGFFSFTTATSALREIYNRTVGSFTLKQADKIIFMSQFSASGFKEFKLNPDKIKIIHPGIDTNIDTNFYLTRAESFKKKFGLENNLVILSIGRTIKRKGFQYLIKAIPNLVKKFPKLKVVIVGPDGGFKEELQRIASQTACNHVVFTGTVSDSEIYEALAAADIFVLSSDFENFPEILIQAMFFSKPVIASRVGGIPELIEHGKSGILFNKGDVEQMSSGILELLEDEKLANYLGKNAHEIAEREYSLRKMAEKTNNVYREVLESKCL